MLGTGPVHVKFAGSTKGARGPWLNLNAPIMLFDMASLAPREGTPNTSSVSFRREPKSYV